MTRPAALTIAAAVLLLAGDGRGIGGEGGARGARAERPPAARTFLYPTSEGRHLNLCAAWDGPHPVPSTCGYAVAWMFCNDNGYRGVEDFMPTAATGETIAYMTRDILDVGRRFKSITCRRDD